MPKRSTVIASLKGALKGAAASGGRNRKRQSELKARLKRAQTPVARPKGKLPNPDVLIRYYAHATGTSRSGRYDDAVTEILVTPEGKEVKGRTILRGLTTAEAKRTAKAMNAKLHARIRKGLRVGRKNPGFFGSEAVAKAKRVQKIRPVVEKDTGERGEIIGSQGRYLKVKWRNRAKPSLISRSELKRGRYPNVTCNPGLLDVVYGLNAFDSVAKRKIKTNAEVRGQKSEVRSTKGKPRSINNPSVRSLSEKFQGRVSNAVQTMKAASSAPSNLARIGKLVLLKVKGMRGNLRIPGAMVAASASEKLWIAGNRTPLLNKKAKPGEVLDYGEIEKIVYLTAKSHIGAGETFEYDHDFESPRPHLYVDHEGMPLIHGGEYKIKAAGITG
jgi:hypothetical protein